MAKIKYLAHPVSKEVVREWNKEGYRVVDARFNPEPEADKPKRTRKTKASD